MHQRCHRCHGYTGINLSIYSGINSMAVVVLLFFFTYFVRAGDRGAHSVSEGDAPEDGKTEGGEQERFAPVKGAEGASEQTV